jgi:ubiquinone/menaquinone biosynthesis C-methylase UbiE
MLFWYTPQITAFNALMSRIATLQSNVLSELCDNLENEAQSRQGLQSELAGLRNEVVQRSMAVQLELTRPDGELKRALRRIDEVLASHKESLDQTVASYAHLRSEIAALRQFAEESLLGHERSGSHARMVGFERAIAQLRTELILQSQRVSVLLLEVRRSLEAHQTNQVTQITRDLDHSGDAVGAAFADVYRGTRCDIQDRLRTYLPALKAAGAGGPQRPILDIGCGRGEWLELLANEGLEASGVDTNRAMLLQCCERGLKVVECDAVAYLRQVPDCSVGAVTAIHILEHLPFDAVLEVLSETVRVLKPGGLAIFETPNPANLLVGSYSFYTDPTHRNPLPSQTLAFLAEARGLCEIEVLPLHPPDESLRIKDDGSEAVRGLNERFFGPQDYAVIGKRP